MFYTQFGLFLFSNKIAKPCDFVLTLVRLSFSGGALSNEDYLVLSSRFGKEDWVSHCMGIHSL